MKHGQNLKQSHAYQSIEAAYAIEIPCQNDSEEIRKTFRQAEGIVEKALVKKMKQQREFLVALAKKIC